MKDYKYKIGITWGAYDLLHFGHLNLLQKSKKLCKKLIVCVSTDEYIRCNKGHCPIVPHRERIKMIKALSCVDEVDIQGINFNKKLAIKKYKPDIIIVGDDWNPKTFTGEGLGVKVLYLPYTKTISSTLIKKKLDIKHKELAK